MHGERDQISRERNRIVISIIRGSISMFVLSMSFSSRMSDYISYKGINFLICMEHELYFF